MQLEIQEDMQKSISTRIQLVFLSYASMKHVKSQHSHICPICVQLLAAVELEAEPTFSRMLSFFVSDFDLYLS